MKKVLIFGAFDLLHPGHLDFFKQAKKLGDSLTVIVARDQTVSAIKKHRTLFNEQERLANVKNQKIVNEARLGNLDDPYKIVKQEKPDIIALGYDQNSYTEELEDKIKEFGFKTKVVRLKPFKPEKYKSSKLKLNL
ncbi:MAG: adenylyltransferase/cytidyltransferase family protein [Patescibacteria group bacterium]|nr:adenylyltransferase/cytidyltransferase family protein [Patescibacteria group bacterium]